MAELFITAFGGFQGVSRNPTEDLLEDVVGRCKDSKTNGAKRKHFMYTSV